MSRLAVIHPTDLLATELRESLDRRRDLWQDLLLFSSQEDEIGTLTEVRGAATVVQDVASASLEGVDVAFFGASIESNRSWLSKLPANTAAIILSPDAGTADGQPIVAGVNLAEANRRSPMLSPHPAAVGLAHLLHPLRGFGTRRVTATILEPVSNYGKAGLDEMFEQTRSILSFDTNPPRDVFPFQMVFNVVPVARPSADIEGQLRAVLSSDALGDEAPISIHLLQAGVFHGYSFSLVLELEENPGVDAVREALEAHTVNELVPDPDTLGPIDAAAREEVLIGGIESTSDGKGYRIWAVMDNLTCGGASNALQILEAISRQVTH